MNESPRPRHNEQISDLMAKRFLTVCVIAMSLTSGRGVAQEASVLARDDFSGKLSLDWTVVRAVNDDVSLTKKPGTLTIATQPGSMARDSVGRRLPPTKNLHLIKNPATEGMDFVVTTCIVAFHPTEKWQQAGLLLYNDDDHYLKNDMEFSGTAVTFKFIREWEQQQLIGTDRRCPPADKVWIRIVKRGNVYERLYSFDGLNFKSAGENTWGDGMPRMLGLVAQNGPSQAPRVDASFDFFEVRALTDEERNDPRVMARKSLQGSWEVAQCELSGQLVPESPIGNFIFDGGKMSFTEGDLEVLAEYETNHAKQPDGFSFSRIERLKSTTVNGIYSLEGDVLKLCFSLNPGGKAPTQWKTERGDSNVLLTLQRAKED